MLAESKGTSASAGRGEARCQEQTESFWKERLFTPKLRYMSFSPIFLMLNTLMSWNGAYHGLATFDRHLCKQFSYPACISLPVAMPFIMSFALN